MKNLFHRSPFRKNTNRRPITSDNHENEFIEILDTDEDRIMNQYDVYLSYIKTFKKELLRGGEALLGYKRNIATHR